MSKKAMKVTVVFILVALVSTSVVGTVQALGKGLTVQTIVTAPIPSTNTLTFIEELVAGSANYLHDGAVRIGHGAVRSYEYDGPLGTGTLYTRTLHSRYTDLGPLIEFPPGSGSYANATGKGTGIYEYTLEIDGDYGDGTLKGIAYVTYDWDFPAFKYEVLDTAKMVPVEGNWDLKWVNVEGIRLGVYWWWTTTTIVT